MLQMRSALLAFALVVLPSTPAYAQQLNYRTEVTSHYSSPSGDALSEPGGGTSILQTFLSEATARATTLWALSNECVRTYGDATPTTEIIRRQQDAVVLDSTKKVYWLAKLPPATQSLAGLDARLAWRRTNETDSFDGLTAERVQFEIEMSSPHSRSGAAATHPSTFLVTGEAWLAPQHKRYALLAREICPSAFSVLPTLAELADLGLMIKSTIRVDSIALQVDVVLTDIVESAAANVLEIPSDYRRISQPSTELTQPQLIRRVPATYPAEAARQKVDGVVVLEITIDVDGNVRNPKILKSPGYGLDESATRAVRQWRYRPARRNGRPVEIQLIVNYEFTYREQPQPAPR